MSNFDIADNPGTTVKLAVGGSAVSAIDDAYDRDWYRVTLEAGKTYQFDVTGTRAANGFLDDSTLRLRSGSGGMIAYDDDSGATFDAQITYSPFETGVFFLDVGGAIGSTGGYLISVSDKTSGVQSYKPPGGSNPSSWGNANQGMPNYWTDNNADRGINNSVEQIFNITVNGSDNVFGDIGNTSFGGFGNTSSVINETTTFSEIGTQGNDILWGSTDLIAQDFFRGGDGDDEIIGFRGADILVGDGGNDVIRGCNGRDVLTGGRGMDELHGGFGQNTFTGDLDGEVDKIFFRSDKYAWNALLNSTNNQDGTRVDIIGKMDKFDQIYVQGVYDSQLSYYTTTALVQGQQVSGIGIFAGNTLEAIYTGDNLLPSELDQMTTGLI